MLVAQLLHLEADNPDRDIQLYINCEGGDPSAMLAVYDTMRYIQPAVATTCVGQAVAVGAVLLAAGAPGKRAALPHARVVLHQPAAQGRGAIPDLILQADEVVRVRADIEEILAEHTGQTVERLRADTDHDRVFTAAEARAYGLVDVVMPPALRIRRRARSSVRAERAAVAGAVARSRSATAEVRSTRLVSSAPATAAIISLEGSLRPRSISERYWGDTPARFAVSVRVSPRS